MSAAAPPGRVVVLGAGAVGCFIGGRLQAAGARVVFVGRPRVLDALASHGLTLTDRAGGRVQIPAAELTRATEAPADTAPGDLWLLCVKSGATEAAARTLPAGAAVLSLQNGITNATRAAAVAPQARVWPGMVPFNIAELGPGHFHRGSDGRLAAQDAPELRAWQALFEAAGCKLALHADLLPVQWGKLLLNLNNPVNALSGLPLRAELLDRDCRRVFAALQTEALAALDAAGIVPAQLTAVSPRWLPRLMRLPTPLFQRMAARMLKIDAKARSSMADDFALGRPTEIDAICGEVVRLARAHGRDAPLAAAIQRLVETDPRPIGGRALRRVLGL